MPDTPTRPTLTQRVVMWILHAVLFYVVALYPVLLMARFQPDDIVHYGFLRWFAVVLVLYWGALQLFFTERPFDSRPGRQTLAVTAAILLIIGVFAPIVSFPFVGDIDFFREGYGDGYILLIMAGLSVALAVTGRWKQVLVPGLGSLAVILWTFLGVPGHGFPGPFRRPGCAGRQSPRGFGTIRDGVDPVGLGLDPALCRQLSAHLLRHPPRAGGG